MKYISTRGECPAVDFEAALLAGLAPDGGLYMPEAWPRLTQDEIWRIGRLPYAEAAAEILCLYAGPAFAKPQLLEMTRAAYAGFAADPAAPVVALADDRFLLELFHGPTLAFKDFAMQILGRLYDEALTRRDAHVTIIAATSGDTGAAAIEALRHCARASVVVLHPEGRVSEVQRRMMTSVIAPNICNIAVAGSFDDCQAIVKTLFADREFSQAVRLSGVNSINWARLAAQIVYYFTSYVATAEENEPVSFVVPTGNFGDVFAGYAAKRMGLPIAKLAVAANANDILHRAISSGDYSPAAVRATASPSMDIQVASNFERLLFETGGRDPRATRQMMEAFKNQNRLQIPAPLLHVIQEAFVSCAVDEAETLAEIARRYEDNHMLVDPHTAVGLAAERTLRNAGGLDGKTITLATAHPAKFPEAVRQATGQTPSLPDFCADLFERPEAMEAAPASVEDIKSLILSRFGAA